MSHFRCPLCGLNRYLNTWSPETYENDIIANTPVGLGRGGGFEIMDEHSVLGDTDITARIITRMANFLKFAVTENIISKDFLIEEFDINSDLKQQKFVPLHNYLFLLRNNDSLIRRLKNLESDYRSASWDASNYKRELDEIEKKRKIESKVKETLWWFQENCDTKILPDREYGYLVEIINVDFLMTINPHKVPWIESDVKRILKKRIFSDSQRVNVILDKFFYHRPREKTLSENNGR